MPEFMTGIPVPEFVTGLPLHALIVHFVVVLLPIAAVGSVVIAVWPAARERFGWLVVAVAAVSTALVPVATSSGSNLATRMPPSPAVDHHQSLANLMIWFAVPMLVFVAALMVVHELRKRRELPFATILMVAAAVLTIGSSVAAGIHVYRVGDAGARAAWGGVKDTPPH
jgi:uncharacterized membrane protein